MALSRADGFGGAMDWHGVDGFWADKKIGVKKMEASDIFAANLFAG